MDRGNKQPILRLLNDKLNLSFILSYRFFSYLMVIFAPMSPDDFLDFSFSSPLVQRLLLRSTHMTFAKTQLITLAHALINKTR